MSRVTAAITTYNRAGMVGAAIQSVLAQTYPDVELIVVDDGSTDGTAGVVAAYGKRVRYLRQANQGRAGARNTAVREASGEYIAFLDSDDLWLPDRLERQVPVLDAHPGVGMVHGHVELIGEAGEPLPSESAWMGDLMSRANRGSATYAGYLLECRCFTSTILLRHDVFERVGVYDPAIAVEDVELYFRVALDYEVAFLDGAPLARYRRHGGQTDNAEMVRGHIAASLKHLALLDHRPDVADRALARRNLHLSLARCHHMLGDGGSARRHVRAAARLDRGVLLRPDVLRWLALSPVSAATRARLGTARINPTRTSSA